MLPAIVIIDIDFEARMVFGVLSIRRFAAIYHTGTVLRISVWPKVMAMIDKITLRYTRMRTASTCTGAKEKGRRHGYPCNTHSFIHNVLPCFYGIGLHYSGESIEKKRVFAQLSIIFYIFIQYH
jgi:hypothetical protein